ncbi:MAG: alpha/beta fold hydrolase [Hydrogenophaga sp.]|jgi:pimeloyl-ACP methyl ester carboxylesterase|uniref:alpha/beta hydrolase n=1 Tax=Hydrogenophaga sp. TaxID=1904254 RepID=UPI002604BC27|nr:alpha/beta fold hydrolase [Hydrogenophaga sp.]MCW5670303.1 alpha/beta fold hydrolase [Hydrogenophaga sp.]
MKPLRTVGTSGAAPQLLVMLPGVGMRPEDIFEAGFAEAIARRDLALDLLAVDISGLGLDAVDTWDALQHHVLTPARERGARVWLGGISLGGMVAMAHLAARPGVADGLCLLAPYPGSRPSVNVIERAGGIERWQPTAQDLQDPELRVWQWLQRPPADLPVFVGHGTEDRFAQRIAQLAERFPPASRHTVPGGHDWSAWQPLWARFLDAGHFH